MMHKQLTEDQWHKIKGFLGLNDPENYRDDIGRIRTWKSKKLQCKVIEYMPRYGKFEWVIYYDEYTYSLIKGILDE
jgi:hypothetical protein